jgi:pyruvate carboxylase subunit B
MSETRNNTPEKKKLEDFTIGGMVYKTTLTRKYKNRKRYEEPDSGKVKAFIPGTIVEIKVKQRQKVNEGEPLLLLEAMKMRNIITAPKEGYIRKIWVKKGDLVAKDQLLVEIE